MHDSNATKLLVFLVEDNPGDMLLVREALSEHGLVFDLEVASNGEKAIEFIDALDDDDTKPCPEVMLLDLNLPRRSGEEVLERLHVSTRCKDIPTIVMSSSEDPHDHAMAARLGVTNYFRKPTDLNAFMTLGSLVRRLVDRTAATGK
jgi:CheY-like chemotaxis protein